MMTATALRLVRLGERRRRAFTLGAAVVALAVLAALGAGVARAEPQVKLYNADGDEITDGRIAVEVGQTFELTIKLSEQPDSTVYFTMHTGTLQQGSPISLQGGSDAFDRYSRAEKRTTVYFRLDQNSWNTGATLLMHGERERSAYWQLSFRGGANPPALYVKGLPQDPKHIPPTTGISIADAKTTEGSPLNFRLTLNSPAPSGGLAISYRTVPDTAGNDDYERTYDTETLKEEATITVPEGATEATIVVQTKIDSVSEPTEKMAVSITAPDGWEGVRSQAVGTIEDRPAAMVYFQNYLETRQVRDEAAGQSISLNFAVQNPHSGTIDVEWSMHGLDPNHAGRAAPADLDFSSMTAQGGTVAITDASKGIGTLRINANTPRASVSIPIVTGDGCEFNEDLTMRFKITQGLANAGAHTVKQFRINHPSCPTLSISDQSPGTVAEGGTGTFTVRISPAPTSPTTINYSFPGLSPRNARASDLPAAGSFTYPANAASYSLQIATVDDNIREIDVESYIVRLSIPSNNGRVRIQDRDGQGKISDGDHGDVISLRHPGAVTEGGTITLTVTSFSRSEPGNKTGPSSMRWRLWHPSSQYENHTDRHDFAAGQVYEGTVNIDPNTLTGTIVIQTKADTVAEGTERFGVTLLTQQVYSKDHYGALTQIIDIQDSEYEQVEIEHRNGPARVYGGQNANYQIRLKQAPSKDVEVKVGFDAALFAVSPATLTFTTTNWNVWQTVAVSVTGTVESRTTHTLSHSIVPVKNSDDEYIIAKSTAGMGYQVTLERPTFNLGTISNATRNEGQSHTYNLNVTGSLLSDITVTPRLGVTRGLVQTSSSDLGIALAGSDTGQSKTVKRAANDPSRRFGFTLTKGTDNDHFDTVVTVTHTVAESPGSGTTAAATIRFRDADQPGLTITAPSGVSGSGTISDPYVLTEGQSYDFGVKLQTNPLQSVQLRASTDVPLMALTATALLNGDTLENDRKTLLPAPSDHGGNLISDWTQTHQVRLTAVTDSNSVGESGRVKLSVQHYNKAGNGFFDHDVYVKISETSALGLILGSGTGPTKALTITEDNDGNFAATLDESQVGKYKVRLGSDPGDGNTVTVTPTSDDPAVKVKSNPLEFTGGAGGNWMVVQEVALESVVDTTTANRSATISHPVTGYTGVSSGPTILVSARDRMGVPRVALSETDQSARMGDTFSYTITTPRPDPGTSATITVTNPDTAKLKIWTGNTEPPNSAASLTLTFTNGNGQQSAVVNVKVLGDSAATVALTHTLSGLTWFGLQRTLTIPDYSVTILATKTIELVYFNGSASGTATAPTLNLIEGSIYAIYWVKLKADPQGSVRVTPMRSNNSKFTVAPGFLDFDSSNWNRYRIFTVKPLHDSNTTAESVTITHTVPAGWVFSSSTNAVVHVNITDDD